MLAFFFQYALVLICAASCVSLSYDKITFHNQQIKLKPMRGGGRRVGCCTAAVAPP